jgi:hypothetical protein
MSDAVCTSTLVLCLASLLFVLLVIVRERR